MCNPHRTRRPALPPSRWVSALGNHASAAPGTGACPGREFSGSHRPPMPDTSAVCSPVTSGLTRTHGRRGGEQGDSLGSRTKASAVGGVSRRGLRRARPPPKTEGVMAAPPWGRVLGGREAGAHGRPGGRATRAFGEFVAGRPMKPRRVTGQVNFPRLCFAFKIHRWENIYFIISLGQILTYVSFSVFKLYGSICPQKLFFLFFLTKISSHGSENSHSAPRQHRA